MRLTIESTPALVEIDGVPCRVWKGTAETGEAVCVYVHRIGVPANSLIVEVLDRELQEVRSPAETRLASPGQEGGRI